MLNNPFLRAIAFRYVSDADTNANGTDGIIAYKTLSAARVVTVAAANTFDPSQGLIIQDSSGSCSGTNTITVTVPAANTLNGSAGASVVLNTPYAQVMLNSDGSLAFTYGAIVISGSATVTSITGSASTLPINGLAAAQGGSVTVKGGTSSTSANAGGAAALTGGTPGATGVGGAASVNGGPGGATSGNGGAASLTAGSATTSGDGGAVTITGGSGAGGTHAGGNINLVPGAAVSTGVPGVVEINGVPGTFDAVFIPPLATTVVPASGTSQMFFLATRAYRVTAVSCIEVTHGTSETIDVIHDTGTGAAGSGTSVLTAAMDPHAASLTVVTGTLTSTVATLLLAAGDRLSFKVGGTVGAAAGLMVSVTLVPA